METQLDRPPVIVVGAGPVGLTAALLLAQANHPVTVYEAKDEIPLSEANSYPIGINPRGQEALHRIDPDLLDRLVQRGEMVGGWHIYARNRRVAKLPSGTVVSTTRAFINQILLEKAAATPGITLVMGHRLTRVDLATRVLHFTVADDEERPVAAGDAIVVAADGVWSATRRSMAEQLDNFSPEVGNWGVRFRVLFSQPGSTAPKLDPSVHYIFSDRGLYSATLKGELWCLGVTVRDGADEEELLLSGEATESNVRALKDYVHTHAPSTTPLFTDQDYADFFTRESFSGAVVRCPFVNVGEWLVLIGDAAHSVIPPTGEGTNSGLEDCCYLADHLVSGSATPLADYNAQRMPDVTALGEYAWHLMNNVKTVDPARQATNLVLRILTLIGKALRINDNAVEEKLFGPKSDCTPYAEIFAPWIRQKQKLFPPVYRVMRAGFDLPAKLGIRRA